MELPIRHNGVDGGDDGGAQFFLGRRNGGCRSRNHKGLSAFWEL